MTLPEGAEYSLTESALSPFQAEPTHTDAARSYAVSDHVPHQPSDSPGYSTPRSSGLPTRRRTCPARRVCRVSPCEFRPPVPIAESRCESKPECSYRHVYESEVV